MGGAALAVRLPFPLARPVPPGFLETLGDDALMARYRDGDPKAFEELYRRHRGRLHRFVRRMVPADADEVFQEVWLAVVAGRHRYAPTARFVTYLFTIAHHRAVARWRAAGRAVAGSDEDMETVSDDRPDALSTVINGELGEALQAAIAQLPPPQREAFLMQTEGGLSLEEIAQASDTSRETVKSRLRYANRRLRAALEDWQ